MYSETRIATRIQLTLNVLVAVVNNLNAKTHSSKETAEFCPESADAKGQSRGFRVCKGF